MSKKQNKQSKQNKVEMVSMKLTRDEATFIEAQLERRNRPNVFKRMGSQISASTRATGRFFTENATKISSSFKSLKDMSQEAETIMSKIHSSKDKKEMVACLDQLDQLSTQMRTFVNSVQCEENPSKIVVEDTAPMIGPQQATN